MTAFLKRRKQEPSPRRSIFRVAAIVGAVVATSATWTAAVHAACIDTSLPISQEEQRLPNKLTNGNANPFAQDLLQASDFTHFEADFINALGGSSTVVKDGTTNVLTVSTDTTSACGAGMPADYNAAFALMTTQGTKLWRAIVDRVQGRKVTCPSLPLPTSFSACLPKGDDRPLYWARTTMTRALNRWNPTWAMTADQRTALQLQLERASRGQFDIKFPAGANYKRIIMSSFDVFTLPNPGTNGTGMRNGNPSAATALSLDGARMMLPDGSTAVVEVFVLPVNYPPFMLGMQEDTLGPFYQQTGPERIVASISMSQGGANQFWLEMWNGRFHGPSAGNDRISLCPTTGNQRLPQADDCDVYPVERWLKYDPKFPTGTPPGWRRDFPAQFTRTTLPVDAMIRAQTGYGVPRPPGDGATQPGAFDVLWHTNFTRFASCDAITGTTNTATTNVNNTQNATYPPLVPPTPPLVDDCARQGGGGDYLSNESAYRNTLLRDVFAGQTCRTAGGLCIPAGHIHTPVMNNFIAGNTAAITDSTFEAWRLAIVEQGRALVFAAARNLGPQPSLTCLVGGVPSPCDSAP